METITEHVIIDLKCNNGDDERGSKDTDST
jgi:hypothetical protein